LLAQTSEVSETWGAGPRILEINIGLQAGRQM